MALYQLSHPYNMPCSFSRDMMSDVAPFYQNESDYNSTLFYKNASQPDHHLTFQDLFLTSMRYHIAVFIELYAFPLALVIGLPEQ